MTYLNINLNVKQHSSFNIENPLQQVARPPIASTLGAISCKEEEEEEEEEEEL